MTLKQIVECLRNNGFKVTGFSSAFSDSGREVCSHAYVYKGKTHVASISQYDKHISTIAFLLNLNMHVENAELGRLCWKFQVY